MGVLNLKNMTDPREFSCMDDAPENNGWGWYRWPDEDSYIDFEEIIDDENTNDNSNENDGENN